MDLELSYEPQVFTLSQLTEGIAKVFEENYPAPLWIKAELAKLNYYPSSGHCYPSLVEKEKGTIKAEMRSTIWANDYLRINRNFLSITREPLKEGIQILFRAMVKYHPVYGLSLQISDIDPSYTLGEMAREKMETIRKLKEEGLFDRNRSVPIPLLPQRIAIISVSTSKGYSDFINILENNQWGYAFSCVLFPALLQGDKAVDSITGQLQAVGRIARHFDVVAIIRGGGGDIGLNCYDNYTLAREVALCPLPVLTGIGHSTNETVVEMIASRNQITPTDVAYFIIQQFHNYAARVEECTLKIIALSRELLDVSKDAWEEQGKKLLTYTDHMVSLEKKHLEQVSNDVITGSRSVLADHRHIISLAGSRLRFKPGLLIREKDTELKSRAEWLSMRVRHLIGQQVSVTEKLEQQVRLLDPQNILRRGYSITYHKGKPITDATFLNNGDIISTRLYKGNIYSEIKSKKE